VVLCPTRHNIGHFGPVPQAKLNLTQQKHTFTNQKKCITTQNKQKKLKPGLVACYYIQPGNGDGLFWFLVSVFHKFVTYLLRHLPTYLQPWAEV